MEIILSKKLSTWCKENQNLAEQAAFMVMAKPWHGRSPAATLEDLIPLVLEAHKNNTNIVYGIDDNRYKNYYFFVGCEIDILNKLGI